MKIKSFLLIIIIAISLCGCKSEKIENKIEYDMYGELISINDTDKKVSVRPVIYSDVIEENVTIYRRGNETRDFEISDAVKNMNLLNAGDLVQIHTVDGIAENIEIKPGLIFDPKPENNNILSVVPDDLELRYEVFKATCHNMGTRIEIECEPKKKEAYGDVIYKHELSIKLPGNKYDTHKTHVYTGNKGIELFATNEDTGENYFIFYYSRGKRMEICYIPGEIKFTGDGYVEIVNAIDPGINKKDIIADYNISRRFNPEEKEKIETEIYMVEPVKGKKVKLGWNGFEEEN